jgi:hypothetical protein
VAVKYLPEELQFIRELFASQHRPRDVAHKVNARFHEGRSIRTNKSIDFAGSKLGVTKRKFTRLCDVCHNPFETSWPQARYCGEDCKAVIAREYANGIYHRNPITNVQAQTERARKRIEERWVIILTHFGDKCGRCKETFPRIVYDLHHPNGKTSRKETPSKIIRVGTDEQFLKMLKETVLVCANCHRLIHAETGNWAPARKDS